MPATTESTPTMRFNEFREMALVSMEDLCREIFMKNQASIKTKKEAVAVRNLTNIFNTTLRLSNEKGFHTMSLRDLSRSSGLSMGALYSYFASKDELLCMIQNQGQRIIQKVLARRVDPADPPKIRLRAAIRTHLYLTEVMQPWFYFSYMEAKNLSKEQRKKTIESELFTEEVLMEILAEGVKNKEFAVENSSLTAAVIKAMLQDWYLKRWKYRHRQVSVQAYADFVIGCVESVVRINPESRS